MPRRAGGGGLTLALLAKGDIVGGYRIEGVLGQGGMAEVYMATQLSLERTVALKVLTAELTADAEFRERFRREGRLQATIDHPHIVPIYEAGESDGFVFLATRFIRGPTLKDLILSREVDAGRALRILGAVADALDAAHQAGLIHRDVKPQNVLVAARDHAFLADFGLTKALGGATLTKTGQFIGTIDYVAPEQAGGSGAAPACDIYSLGALLYECLTGTVPFPRPSAAAVLMAHMSDAPPRVTERREDLPLALDDVIARAMAKDPGGRHSSAAELVKDAERAFGQDVRAAIRAPGPLKAPEEAGIRPLESD